MEQQTGLKLQNEHVKAVYYHPAYLTYMQSTIMWNARLDESQVGIKIARWYINNLRHADDNTLRAESKEELKSLLIRLNCGVGGDSWESLGLQGDPTSLSWRKSTLNIHWKDWCWSWSSNTSVTWCEELTYWKRPWCWERLKAGEGEDRGWDGWMASPTYGHGFEQTLEDGEGQGSQTSAVHGVAKSQIQLSG